VLLFLSRTYQRLAAWLASGIGAQLLVHRRELRIHRTYHLKRDRGLLAHGGRQLKAPEHSRPIAVNRPMPWWCGQPW
jgi:hypothetical protein